MNKNLERFYKWKENKSNFLLFDVEANTDWEWDLNKMEIIQIWYIKFDSEYNVLNKGSIFVKPSLSPQLTDFIIDLTWITQEEVDTWMIFSDALREFLGMYNKDTDYIMSYGNYDMKQLLSDCKNNNLVYPFDEWDIWKYSKHINVKNALAKKIDIREKWMWNLLKYLWLELEGKHHNWEDDCLNILKLVKHVFK